MAIDNIAPLAYTDINGLGELKLGAKAQTPQALREAARQFESIFTRMMLKTMREASSGDALFDSEQSGFFRDMFDDQLSVDMSRGHGLGLAEQLVAQMMRAGIVNATPNDSRKESKPGSSTDSKNTAVPAAPELKLPARSTNGIADAATRVEFIQNLLPSAITAGKVLGVDPRTLLAHAALETGWGRSQPTAANGLGSNNLFGVKATAQWRGATIDASTVEFDAGGGSKRLQRFRAYDSTAASFADYVALLRGNPRYAAVLGQGNDAVAFAGALQKAGYATDPQYAEKLVATARRVRDVVDNFLKDGHSPPIASARAPG